MRLTAVAVLCVLALASEAHRILLVFPMPISSHFNLAQGLVRHLLRAEHHVTYITPFPVKNPPPNLREIEVSSVVQNFPANEILNLTKLMSKELPQLTLGKMLEVSLSTMNASLFHGNVQRLLRDPAEQFDLVIADWVFTELYAGNNLTTELKTSEVTITQDNTVSSRIAAVFNCPLIWVSTMEVHSSALAALGEDSNPAYVISLMSRTAPPFNFMQRVGELWTYLTSRYYKWLANMKETSIYEAALSTAAALRGRQLPPYSEVQYNASLMFGNSHVSVGSAISLPQIYVPVAGYHIEENVTALPQNLQNIMDNAEHGVIFFSMGSILRSKSMPTKLKQGLLQMFSQLKQTVIWKLEESMETLPKNVHIIDFAPQQSILAHPNCVLFITHGGLLSNIEAVHFGVPVVGVPVFADQFLNVDRALRKGYALRLALDHHLPGNMNEAIEEVLGNPSYRERVQQLSWVYHARAVPPAQELLHWVELVVRTRGAPHLRNPALLLPAYQRMFLDLLAAVFFVTGILYSLAKFMFTRNKVDTKKKQN